MLDIKRVLKSAKAPKLDHLIRLITPWGECLDPDRILPEHPRPTMVRTSYTSLNGRWDYAIVAREVAASDGTEALSEDGLRKETGAATPPDVFDGTILVPFSPEAPLSGVERTLRPDEFLWYRRRVPMPPLEDSQRLILHFEAVDWVCALRIDGMLVATHADGYLPFDIDVTPYLHRTAEEFEIALCVADPSDAGVQPRGKQQLEPGGIWYTAQSGIWQSVWYEVVPAAHLCTLTLKGEADGTLDIEARVADPARMLPQGAVLVCTLLDNVGGIVATTRLPFAPARADTPDGLHVHERVHIAGTRSWSPEDPYLYDVEVTLVPAGAHEAVDAVRSYCAFRSVAIQRDAQGFPRLFLNGSPRFVAGVLDQGYWPDGLMTAPADAALVHDIEAMRAAGYNMLRKHIKVECARWYYHCDRLGMLVWQDAVSGGGTYSPWHTSRKPTLFQTTWGRFADDTPAHRIALSSDSAAYRSAWMRGCTGMVRMLAGHPSIVTWVLFNEGWGQFDARTVTEIVHAVDATRPIDATSGWYDQGCGDFLSHHNYFRPLGVARDCAKLSGYAARRGFRAFALSEFGGLTLHVAGHTATPSTYGYGDFPDADAWRAAVLDLIDRARALERCGLAGFVYTQVSDVEGELNGLLTADRRVNKLNG